MRLHLREGLTGLTGGWSVRDGERREVCVAEFAVVPSVCAFVSRTSPEMAKLQMRIPGLHVACACPPTPTPKSSALKIPDTEQMPSLIVRLRCFGNYDAQRPYVIRRDGKWSYYISICLDPYIWMEPIDTKVP